MTGPGAAEHAPGARGNRREVVVVGSGQAGLAIGYFLKQQGRDFTILEAGDAPAAAWRARWDSLRLFTPVKYDSLPGRAFPGDPDSYPGRDDVVAYLTDYASAFELPVELDSAVRSVRRADEGGYLVELDDRTYAAEQVVIATGPFQVPRVPPIAHPLDASVVQCHSTAYRRPEQVPAGRPVLVAGGGNTGFQIAEELARTHEVHLSIGSRQTPLPQRIAGRDLFDYLQAIGLMRATVDSRLAQRLRYRDTLIGSSPRAARRRGIRLRGRTADAQGSEVVFADGTRLAPAAVIWATGFAVDHSFVRVPVFDDAARLMHRRGVTCAPGLYFLGLTWQHTRGSALLGWVKDDARFIAQRVAELAQRPGARAPVAQQQPVVR
jgi:putative flavoprotein involved in K+ transport